MESPGVPDRSQGSRVNGEKSAAALACARRARTTALHLDIAMGFKTILVPIEQHDLANSTLQTALLLARKFDSYIEGFALRVEIPAVIAVGDVSGVPIPGFEQDITENEKRSRNLFETFMQEHGVPRAGEQQPGSECRPAAHTGPQKRWRGSRWEEFDWDVRYRSTIDH
jgi:hypothetical protein